MRRACTGILLFAFFFGLVTPGAEAGPVFAQSVVAPAEVTGEPGLAVDDRASPPIVYVDTLESSTQLWRSTDGGKRFKKMAATTGVAADSDVVVDGNRTVYVSDLFDSGNGTIPVSTSFNFGKSYRRKVDVGDNGGSYDRQWLASNGPSHLAVTATDNADQVLKSWVSDDSGKLFAGPFDIGESDTAGPLTAGPDHTYYIVYSASDGLRYARSPDGTRWRNGVVAAGHFPALFPVIAVDDANVLYVAWSEESFSFGLGTTSPIYVVHSTNGGRTWSRPKAISPTTTDVLGDYPSAVFPWIVAGAKGKVGVSYLLARTLAVPDLGSNLGGPQTTWDLVVAQSTNALSSKPKWTTTVAAPSIHKGSVCTQGLACPSPQNVGIGNYPGPFDRGLLDFFESGLDRDGRMYVVYEKDRPVTAGSLADVIETTSDVMLARQVGGTRLRP